MAGLIWNLLGGLIFPFVVWTYENIALHKPAWQLNPYKNDEFNASLAVDGQKKNLSQWGGECVASEYGRKAEWRVDLTGIRSIHHIAIQYVQNKPVWDAGDYKTKAFLGFSIYISNTTTKEDGVLCFKDTNYTRATIPNPVNITCPYHGRYVIYYNNRTHRPFPDGYSYFAYTDLCEVEVFGCLSPGLYGENCSLRCPRNCQEGHCDIVEGNCLGCIPGYQSFTCDEECEQFTYGLGCNQTCGNCSKGEQCNHLNGRCLNGCDVGVYGDKCDSECLDGKHGQNCEEHCSKHCMISETCDRVTGHCIGGCQAGWTNAQCDQECSGGMFGQHCNQSCGKCLNNEQCHHVNGSCLDGCDSGYRGTNCTEECTVGLYGPNCERLCSANCREPGVCDMDTGHCKGGCQAGWTQRKCDIECQDGLYGQNCQENCSAKCIVFGRCDKVTGQCEGGCQAGWKQSNCDAMCDNGMFGQDCTERCGQCLGKEECHHVNGSCINGCKSGYHGLMCTKEETSTPTRGQNILGAVVAPILITVFVIVAVVVLFIGRKRFQSKPTHIELTNFEWQGERTETNLIVSNNCHENEFSTLYTNVSHSYKQEVTPKSDSETASNKTNTEITESSEACISKDHIANDYQEDQCSPLYTNVVHSYITEVTPTLECKKASIKRNKERPENSETCISKEHITNENQVDKCSIKGTCDIGGENTPDIPVNQLHETIVEMKKLEDKGFKREYSMLSNGELFPCNVGKRQENLSKNRYKTILPYDHSRVILHGDNGCSEYINASFIEDTKREFAYIATQGPTQNSVNEFWRMVWQQNVSEIVMLTNLMEGKKIKCFQYWPDCLKTELYDSVTIENVFEKQYAFYITRKFVVSHKQHNMSRDIIQYHYTMWPDHGTPEPLNLAVFHSQVLRTSSDENRTPLVVHCSAGIGRTGTFIALDALYKEGKRTGKVNVAKYVKIMRSCRMNMVQTYEQYVTIFLALNERCNVSFQRQSLSSFGDKLDSVLNSPEKQTYIGKEFEKLLNRRPEYTIDDYLEASYHVNKNYDELPLDRYILYLTSPVANRGSYINAINVSSYQQNNAFIVTHYPPPEDAVDFLRLLVDHESNTVICMDPLSKITSSKSWLPESSSDKMVDPFSVQRVGETWTNVKVTEIRILNEEELSHAVSIVEPREVPGPDGTSSSLRSLVSYAMDVTTEGPITVVSKDGASMCGAFCAVFNCIQQIIMDDSVDVFTTVRQLQTQRPEFCTTLEEYLLVYRALFDYIWTISENMYENM
uniref:protein-tyrosine-phosphatase n=1 Tax=Crassostrea virginica TaxID=6565 RepID=A0A8B8C1W1_CRAVI|nr:receptor-type tyrosine-protein phosphatase mu-like isoform X2 [Crassostrea virginica]